VRHGTRSTRTTPVDGRVSGTCATASRPPRQAQVIPPRTGGRTLGLATVQHVGHRSHRHHNDECGPCGESAAQEDQRDHSLEHIEEPAMPIGWSADARCMTHGGHPLPQGLLIPQPSVTPPWSRLPRPSVTVVLRHDCLPYEAPHQQPLQSASGSDPAFAPAMSERLSAGLVDARALVGEREVGSYDAGLRHPVRQLVAEGGVADLVDG
jgi:hypothetical protein